ncbi:MAG: methyltransferase domain-containing protein [Pseudohongiellaceae bacterium]
MTHAAGVLVENIDLLLNLPHQFGVLDLACGNGRNGLLLAREGVPVTFADSDQTKIENIEKTLAQENLPGRGWWIDLELDGNSPLEEKCFNACLVFNYLYRPGLNSLKRSIVSGGLVYYETFTLENRKYGRPSNTDFLLQPGELAREFEGWDVLHYFEGELKNPDRAIANIIARKP